MRFGRRKRTPASAQIPIAPMIDCVFLLLVYFISTSSMKRTEADLAFKLPTGGGPSSQPLTVQQEQVIEISDQGNPVINGFQYPRILEGNYDQLLESLLLFRETCEQAELVAKIEIVPHERAPHEALVQLLDVLNRSRITDVRFRL